MVIGKSRRFRVWMKRRASSISLPLRNRHWSGRDIGWGWVCEDFERGRDACGEVCPGGDGVRRYVFDEPCAAATRLDACGREPGGGDQREQSGRAGRVALVAAGIFASE